ncbi:MAG: hypothetical protein IMW91_06165 [Firmicutes bacterium]|nr:hypothetical protein [Bacillota bacterium]
MQEDVPRTLAQQLSFWSLTLVSPLAAEMARKAGVNPWLGFSVQERQRVEAVVGAEVVARLVPRWASDLDTALRRYPYALVWQVLSELALAPPLTSEPLVCSGVLLVVVTASGDARYGLCPSCSRFEGRPIWVAVDHWERHARSNCRHKRAFAREKQRGSEDEGSFFAGSASLP